MKGVTILDRDINTGFLAFGLHDILNLLGSDAIRSTWTARDVECLGDDAAKKLEEASDRAEPLDGAEFVGLVLEVHQVIDGEFSARLPNDACDWITIRSVDSSAYDVFTNRDDVLRKLVSRFRNVKEIPAGDSS